MFDSKEVIGIIYVILKWLNAVLPFMVLVSNLLGHSHGNIKHETELDSEL